MNGSPVLFRVTAPLQLTELNGNFLGQEFSFRSSTACHCWYGFAGVSLATKPGTYTLRVEGKSPAGKEATMSYAVAVGAAHYPTSAIKVAPAFVEPPKETLASDRRRPSRKESRHLRHVPEIRCGQEVLSRRRKLKTQAYLDRRACFNGVKKSQHTGPGFPRDDRYARSSPLTAGTVILARPLYFEGNCVMIDHGQGLLTMYMHLSEFKVKEGDTVAEGPATGAQRRHRPGHSAASALCRALARGISGSANAAGTASAGKLKACNPRRCASKSIASVPANDSLLKKRA